MVVVLYDKTRDGEHYWTGLFTPIYKQPAAVTFFCPSIAKNPYTEVFQLYGASVPVLLHGLVPLIEAAPPFNGAPVSAIPIKPGLVDAPTGAPPFSERV